VAHPCTRYILRRNGWSETNGVLGLLTGRKTGKSTACAMACIIVMMCIQSAQIIVTSRTLKQAQIILNTVRILIRIHPLFKKWGFKMGELQNTTVLTFIGPDGSERKIEALCGDGTACFPSSLLSFRRGERERMIESERDAQQHQYKQVLHILRVEWVSVDARARHRAAGPGSYACQGLVGFTLPLFGLFRVVHGVAEGVDKALERTRGTHQHDGE
jgi:hypothetical protein